MPPAFLCHFALIRGRFGARDLIIDKYHSNEPPMILRSANKGSLILNKVALMKVPAAPSAQSPGEFKIYLLTCVPLTGTNKIVVRFRN